RHVHVADAHRIAVNRLLYVQRGAATQDACHQAFLVGVDVLHDGHRQRETARKPAQHGCECREAPCRSGKRDEVILLRGRAALAAVVLHTSLFFSPTTLSHVWSSTWPPRTNRMDFAWAAPWLTTMSS